jgi:hypothetical protein
MKTIIRIAAIAILASLSVSSAPAADERPAARAKYAELAAKVRTGDMGIDWKALRVAAAIGEVGDLTPASSSAVQNGYATLNEGKFNDALKTGREIEDRNIADIDGHYLAWRSLTGLGRGGEAEKERVLLAALLQSITDSGDGKSAKTAWFATTIRETYLYMGSVLNVQFQEHRTWKEDGHYYDVVSVKDESGKERILWFNADTEMQRQMAAGEQANHK